MTAQPTPTTPTPIPRQLVAVARDIKVSHTVFALPFALLAMVLAALSADRLPAWGEVGLILLCMVAARTFAMAFNRWADAALDGANARTQNRAIPSGRVGRQTMLGVVLGCAALFEIAAAGFLIAYDNALPLLLGPGVLIVLAAYSYTKRFTWLCHVVLGFALAISPVAAAIAIEPGFLQRQTVWLLMAMVLCWVAGFDVLYALQDTEADRRLKLHSIPSRLGVGRALLISRALHGVAAAAVVAIAIKSELVGLLFSIAAALTCLLLIIEHALVFGGKTRQLNMAFFTVNGVISVLLGAAGITDALMRN